MTESGIEYERDGCRITASSCEHPHTSITVKTTTTTVCDDCGRVVKTETQEGYLTASTFSIDYPEIVFGVGGLAVGFVAAMLIPRRKKVAVSSTAAEEKEY